MSLPEFKFIFMIEFLHRILGRIIGLTFLLPLIYFYAKNIIPKKELGRYLLMLAVLCLQGFMGWYMVKSGLYKEPHVSHYRLSIHLTIAAVLYALVVWQMLQYLTAPYRPYSYALRFLLLLIFAQIFFGGMVAGLKAGLVYSTFPLMGVSFIPPELDLANLSDAVTVQFIHRILAYLVFLSTCYLSYDFYKNGSVKNALILFIPCFVQVLLGVLTLIYFVPMSFALAHQICAIVLVTAVLYVIKAG
jgi:cytochrome c oxidase assembly protein subunit 15